MKRQIRLHPRRSSNNILICALAVRGRQLRRDDEENPALRGRVQQDTQAEARLALDWSIDLGPSRPRGEGDAVSQQSEVDLRKPPYFSSRPVSWNGSVTFHFRHSFISLAPSRPRLEVAVRDERGREMLLNSIVPLSELKSSLSNVPSDRADRVSALPKAHDRAYAARGVAKRHIVAETRLAVHRADNWNQLPKELSKAGLALARAARVKSRSARPPSTASKHQAYIERQGRFAARAGGLELLPDGSSSSDGTIGADPDERQAFWKAVEKRERGDGRVQSRLTFELPCEVGAIDRRWILKQFAKEFDDRKLLWHAVVHSPDPHGDPRNFHGHFVYHDRPAIRRAPYNWEFASNKDRDAQGPSWIRMLRARFADYASRALKMAGKTKRYDPRTYAAMSIPKTPTKHIGPRAMALERSGVPTKKGSINIVREQEFEIADEVERVRVACEEGKRRVEEIRYWSTGRTPALERLRQKAVDVAERWLWARIEELREELRASKEIRARRDALGRMEAKDEWEALQPQRRIDPRSLALVKLVATQRGTTVRPWSRASVNSEGGCGAMLKHLGRLERAWRVGNMLADREEEEKAIQVLEKKLHNAISPVEWVKETQKIRDRAHDMAARQSAVRSRLVELVEPYFREGVSGADSIIERAMNNGGDWRNAPYPPLSILKLPTRGIPEAVSEKVDRLVFDICTLKSEWARCRREAMRREALEKSGKLDSSVLTTERRQELREEIQSRRDALKWTEGNMRELARSVRHEYGSASRGRAVFKPSEVNNSQVPGHGRQRIPSQHGT